MAREGTDFGPSILDGELRYLSTSQLDKADESVYGGCPRRWWYRYKARKKEPEFASQKLGTQVHAQIEHYLKTGEDVMGPIVREGRRFVPRWNDDGKLRVEWSFARLRELEPAGSYGPIDSPLRVLGVPFIGFVDLLNLRGEWVDDDGTVRPEPGVPEVVDWKTTSQIQTVTDEKTGRVTRGYAKTADELAAGWQMTTYDLVVLEEHPDAPAVRDSHGYFQTRGKRDASKRSKLVPAGEIRSRRGRLEALVARMKEWARAERAEDVPEPATYAACDAYRGCPFKGECPRDPKKVLVSLVGKGASRRVLSDKKRETQMSIMDKLKQKDAATKGGAAPARDPEVEREIAALEAEEAGAGIAPPDKPAPSKTHEPLPASARVPSAVTAARGGGEGLKIKVEASCGHMVAEAELSRLQDGTIKHLGCPGAEKPAELPPKAAEAFAPGEPCPRAGSQAELDTDAAVTKKHKCACGATVKVKPVKMGDKWVSQLPKHAAPGEKAAPKAEEKPEPAKEEPKAAKSEEAEGMYNGGVAQAVAERIGTMQAPGESDASVIARAKERLGVHLYLDASEDGVRFERLEAYAEGICRAMEKEYGVPDVRAAQDGPLAFGKWKGILEAFVRADPPAPGYYQVSAGSEVGMAAFYALASMGLGRVVRKGA